MKRKRKQTDWFDTFAYLLMTGFIVLFILGVVRSQWERMLFFLAATMALCVALLMVCLRQKKMVDKYKELQRWIKEGNLEDRSVLSDSLREEMSEFFAALEHKYSYENLKTNMEYSALQNQINPHFLYNTLDAIRSQALAAGETEIADMTGKMSRFYRYSIKNRGDLVPLGEEVRNVEDYFSIQQYRFENRFSLEILCDDPEIFYCYIPKMTFQPIVENSLYHGLEMRKGAGKITVRISRLEKTIHIVISDNGKGMDEPALEKIRERLDGRLPREENRGKRTGIAIYNVNKRLKILFGDAYGLAYSSIPGMGTDVEIRIPLVNEENRGQFTSRT